MTGHERWAEEGWVLTDACDPQKHKNERLIGWLGTSSTFYCFAVWSGEKLVKYVIYIVRGNKNINHVHIHTRPRTHLITDGSISAPSACSAFITGATSKKVVIYGVGIKVWQSHQYKPARPCPPPKRPQSSVRSHAHK